MGIGIPEHSIRQAGRECLLIMIMEICKAPTLQLKALNPLSNISPMSNCLSFTKTVFSEGTRHLRGLCLNCVCWTCTKTVLSRAEIVAYKVVLLINDSLCQVALHTDSSCICTVVSFPVPSASSVSV